MPIERMLVSKTDLKGTITYVNDAFVEISGFTREELIGQSHNIVRHPDMPPQVFKDLWDTLQEGYPWQGLVKNRTKNGDFYWIHANVVPVTKDGDVTGYMSVRTAPSRQDVSQAESLYSELRRSKRPLSGQQKSAWSLQRNLFALGCFLIVLLTGFMALGLKGMADGHQNLIKAYSEQSEPIAALERTLALMEGAYKHVALGVTHSSRDGQVQHTHSNNMHSERIRADITEIVSLRLKIAQHPQDAEFKASYENFIQTTDEYLQAGLQQAAGLLESEKYDAVTPMLEGQLSTLYAAAKSATEILDQHIVAEGLTHKLDSEAAYQRNRLIYLCAFALGCLLLIVAGIVFLRHIRRDLDKIIFYFRRISEGVLTDDVEITRRDELGDILSSFAVMQTNLKVMLDNIQSAVRQLLQSSADLDAQMYMVTMQSQLQQQEIESVAATTEEFSLAVIEISENARQALNRSSEAEVKTRACNDTMQASLSANTQVVNTVNQSSQIISALNQSIQKIGDVTQTIKDIAEETNLLALNAAIEAARAGEAGRGFAVVADEVRKLSENTAKSTRDISSLVSKIQSFTQNAVESMGLAVAEVHLGVGRMQQGVDELKQITEASQSVNQMSGSIAGAAQEQAMAGQAVAHSMESVATMVEQNTEIANQALALAKGLLNTADRLKRTMGTFQIFKAQSQASSDDAVVEQNPQTGMFIEM